MSVRCEIASLTRLIRKTLVACEAESGGDQRAIGNLLRLFSTRERLIRRVRASRREQEQAPADFPILPMSSERLQ